MKPYTAWSPTEDATLVRMRGAGANREQIAGALQRSPFSIMSRIAEHNRRLRAGKPLPPAPPPTATIPKAMVPQFYELGWRLVSFGSELCLFEWRSSGEPRWPHLEIEEVARAVLTVLADMEIV
jgi:hypothetical protein